MAELMPWEKDWGSPPETAANVPWEKDWRPPEPDTVIGVIGQAARKFGGDLASGQYPRLYNPKNQLFPNNPFVSGPSKQPPQMHGLDLPTFGVGMGEAPGVTLGVAALGTLGGTPTRALAGAAATVAKYGWPFAAKQASDWLGLPHAVGEAAGDWGLVRMFGPSSKEAAKEAAKATGEAVKKAVQTPLKPARPEWQPPEWSQRGTQGPAPGPLGTPPPPGRGPYGAPPSGTQPGTPEAIAEALRRMMGNSSRL